MNMLPMILAFGTAMAVSQPVHANFSAELNGAKQKGEWGGEIGVGYSIIDANGFRITPIAGVFLTEDEDNPFYWDDNGGNERCRDSRDGQYASDSDCFSADVAGYAGGEITYSFDSKVTVGGGAIYIHEDIKPYGTIGVNLSKKVSVKGKVGKAYVAAGLHFGF